MEGRSLGADAAYLCDLSLISSIPRSLTSTYTPRL
jgi:hypothetical protein